MPLQIQISQSYIKQILSYNPETSTLPSSTVEKFGADFKIWWQSLRIDQELKLYKKMLMNGESSWQRFDNVLAKRFGKKYGVFVNSGSSACLLAIAALDLPKGCKIITPACTFSTTLAPIIQLGYKPVFCDVDLTSYVPTVEDIIALIDADVKAIMVPNLIGNKPDWKTLRSELKRIGREDIIVIEDSADTIAYTEETDVATTSFYASHVITAGGTGGMVMFNDKKHVERALQYRDWGRMGDNSEIMDDRFNHSVDGIPYDHKFLYSVLGYNFKCSEMSAAFGLVQLKRFETFESIRRANVERYLENLKDVKEIILPDDSIKPNWLAIPLQTERRLELLTFLENNNVQTRVTFAGNVTRHPVYREYLQPFDNSDTIMKNGFLLGAHHGMTIEDVDYVCDKIKEFFNK
jgi:CDP-6-deoxy-D-xylo-4-hexulose-3-dehydrase